MNHQKERRWQRHGCKSCRHCRCETSTSTTQNCNSKHNIKRRRHHRLPFSKSAPSTPLLLFLYTAITATTHFTPHQTLTNAAVVTWTNGPEDNFFCGYSWDDPPDCSRRQNCRSGRDDECEGYETHGVQCFANTECDTKMGGAAAWEPGMISKMEPTATPSGIGQVNFDDLLADGLFTPTSSPHTPGSPTQIPTELPIAPPPDFIHASENRRDHNFCGVGFTDANDRCQIHCPNSNECATGEICYFDTKCDARTHVPTPPPTRRPTTSPTTAR